MNASRFRILSPWQSRLKSRRRPYVCDVGLGTKGTPWLLAKVRLATTGKLVEESKADMKKRGLRSPDLADAFLHIRVR